MSNRDYEELSATQKRIIYSEQQRKLEQLNDKNEDMELRFSE